MDRHYQRICIAESINIIWLIEKCFINTPDIVQPETTKIHFSKIQDLPGTNTPYAPTL